ncbi:hypothetical protein WICPIJ_007975 [Wickerhamomyces pijperi]|uniref:Uncharacterized protein n=1 Tax=Wickerhamomyces pijperi TaxID=599730 RepID=A0A9P8TJE9_WICPI|nr:hypothetical protein WICPIJ_007975 [Wickerhamomyces pijperi]
MSTDAPLPSVVRYKRAISSTAHSLELLSLENEINELLQRSHLTSRQRESFLELVRSMFDLFQMPVKQVGGDDGVIEFSLIDKASVRLFERFQTVVMLLTQLTMKEDASENGDNPAISNFTPIKSESSELHNVTIGSEPEDEEISPILQAPDLSAKKNISQHRESIIEPQIKRNRDPSSVFSRPPLSQDETILTEDYLNDMLPQQQFLKDYRSPFRDPKIANIHKKFEKITKGHETDEFYPPPPPTLPQQHQTPVKPVYLNDIDMMRSASQRSSVYFDNPPSFSSTKHEDHLRSESPSRSMSHYTPASHGANSRIENLFSTGGRLRPNDLNARAMSYNLNHSPSSYKTREDIDKRTSMHGKSVEPVWSREQVQEMAKRERYLRTRSVYEHRDTLKFGANANLGSPQPTFTDRSSPVSNRIVSTPKNKAKTNRYSMLSTGKPSYFESSGPKRHSAHSKTASINFDDSFTRELKGQNSDDEKNYDQDQVAADEDEDDEFDDEMNNDIINLSDLSSLSGSSIRFSTRF